MKNEMPTKEEISRIFMQYLYQNFCFGGDSAKYRLVGINKIGNFITDTVVRDQGFGVSRCTLILKGVKNISNEHKLIIANIESECDWELTTIGNLYSKDSHYTMFFGDEITDCYINYDNAPGADDRLSLNSLQKLYEWGYALPYKNFSVRQLEEFGIYKIIE